MITRDANRMTSDVNGDEGVEAMGCLGAENSESKWKLFQGIQRCTCSVSLDCCFGPTATMVAVHEMPSSVRASPWRGSARFSLLERLSRGVRAVGRSNSCNDWWDVEGK